MKISLKELKKREEDSFLLEYRENLTLGEDKEYTLSSPVFVKFRIFFDRSSYNVVIIGKLTYTLKLICSRCLEEFEKNFSLWVRGIFKFKRDYYNEKEIELTKRDLDIFYYKNGEIDLDKFVIESIIVNVPMKPLCKEDCKGLCPICGTNLNIETCNCKIEDIKESPFKVLSYYLGGGKVDNTKKENIQSKKR